MNTSQTQKWKMKKVKTAIIVIMAVLTISLTSFGVYIRCANYMPYVYATHSIYMEYKDTTYNYSNMEIKEKLEDLVGVNHYIYKEQNIERRGRTLLMFRIITIQRNLSQMHYIDALCHELLHLKYYSINERFVMYKTFITLYNSEFKQVAINIAYRMKHGYYPYEYECYAQIVEYLKKQPI